MHASKTYHDTTKTKGKSSCYHKVMQIRILALSRRARSFLSRLKPNDRQEGRNAHSPILFNQDETESVPTKQDRQETHHPTYPTSDCGDNFGCVMRVWSSCFCQQIHTKTEIVSCSKLKRRTRHGNQETWESLVTPAAQSDRSNKMGSFRRVYHVIRK